MITREYKDGDEESIVELLDTVFNGWPKYDISDSPVDFWRWKYSEEPAQAKIFLIENDGKIVASHHNWRQNVWIKNRSFIINEGMDYGVHPDYRGKGLSTKVSELVRQVGKQDNIPLTYVITENPIVLKGHEKNSNVKKFPKKIVNLILIKDVSKQLRVMPMQNGWFLGIGYRFFSWYNAMINLFNDKKIKSMISIESVGLFPDSINEYWEKVKKHYDFSIELNDKYLNWRYCDSRIGGYKILIASVDNSIVGFIVLRKNSLIKEYPIGYVVELSYLPNMSEVGSLLIAEAIKYFENVNVINYLTVDEHPDIKIFKKFGFINSRITLHVNYEHLLLDDPFESLEISKPEKIHIAWGNFDVLPVKVPNI